MLHGPMTMICMCRPWLCLSAYITYLFLAVNLIVEVVGTPMGPVVNAADSLTLLCRAAGGTNTYSYQWSSNCTGNCFVDGQTGHELIRDALRSTDSGNHTCVVTDDAGNTGSESIMIGVQGRW